MRKYVVCGGVTLQPDNQFIQFERYTCINKLLTVFLKSFWLVIINHRQIENLNFIFNQKN